MKFSNVFYIALLVPLTSWGSYTKLRLVMPNFSPFTYAENGDFKGYGYERVSKILDDMGVSYSVKLVPTYAAAVTEVKSQLADGFFLASKNYERDSFAVFSKPMMINRWSWFVSTAYKNSPKNIGFKENARIGTPFGTNTQRWLEQNGYQVTNRNPDVSDLINNLKLGRIDAIFMAEMVFKEFADGQGLKHTAYQQYVQSSRDFGVYISKKYLAKNKGFMAALNKQIDNLHTIGLQD
ncbi:substrate-binding periplasmic protein [Dongshaea marina]|uniref:substrate-binding periplasmic protein n=1 Tax=Dongshaea marina TaxID=2047966 RepID=UPI000D3EA054|nr:transporter substrate-binding domain-containing protein [Dongshaea marina]